MRLPGGRAGGPSGCISGSEGPPGAAGQSGRTNRIPSPRSVGRCPETWPLDNSQTRLDI